MKEERSSIIGGKRYDYVLDRKNVKNITLRVKESGIIQISAPTRITIARIEEILATHTAFIDKARRKLEARRVANPPLRLVTGESLPIWGFPHTICVQSSAVRSAKTENGVLYLAIKNPDSPKERRQCFAEFVKKEADARLTARTRELTPLFAPKPPKVPSLTFRTMKTKWGVCRPKNGHVTLNRNLVFLPPALVDYVICHELAHFHHADHSAAFWNCLKTVMPDCKERRKAMNAFPLPQFDSAEG